MGSSERPTLPPPRCKVRVDVVFVLRSSSEVDCLIPHAKKIRELLYFEPMHFFHACFFYFSVYFLEFLSTTWFLV